MPVAAVKLNHVTGNLENRTDRSMFLWTTPERSRIAELNELFLDDRLTPPYSPECVETA